MTEEPSEYVMDDEKTYESLRIRIPKLKGEMEHHYLMLLQWIKDEGAINGCKRIHARMTGGKGLDTNQVYAIQRRNLWVERLGDLEKMLADRLEARAKEQQEVLDRRNAKSGVRRTKQVHHQGLTTVPNAQTAELLATPETLDLEAEIVATRETKKRRRITALSESQEQVSDLIREIAAVHANRAAISEMKSAEALKLLPSLMAAQISLQKAEREELGEVQENEKVDISVVIKTIAVQLNLSPAEEEEFKMQIFATHRELQHSEKVQQGLEWQAKALKGKSETDEEMMDLMGVSKQDLSD